MDKNTKNKTPAEEFADSIKDNPQEIIDWAKSEIREYENLIEILERSQKINRMIVYKDRTYCASPSCVGMCGRKITKREESHARKIGANVCYGDFCDKNGRPKPSEDN